MGVDERREEPPEPVGSWHPDPWGRAESRYYDGKAWTTVVATAGVVASDAPGPDADPAVSAPPAAGAGAAGTANRSALLWVIGVPLAVVLVLAAVSAVVVLRPSRSEDSSLAGGETSTTMREPRFRWSNRVTGFDALTLLIETTCNYPPQVTYPYAYSSGVAMMGTLAPGDKSEVERWGFVVKWPNRSVDNSQVVEIVVDHNTRVTTLSDCPQ
jgi:hypothetical protein